MGNQAVHCRIVFVSEYRKYPCTLVFLVYFRKFPSRTKKKFCTGVSGCNGINLRYYWRVLQKIKPRFTEKSMTPFEQWILCMLNLCQSQMLFLWSEGCLFDLSFILQSPRKLPVRYAFRATWVKVISSVNFYSLYFTCSF